MSNAAPLETPSTTPSSPMEAPTPSLPTSGSHEAPVQLKEATLSGEVDNEPDWNAMEEFGYDVAETRAATPASASAPKVETPAPKAPTAPTGEPQQAAPNQAVAKEQASPVPAPTQQPEAAAPAPAPQATTETGPVSIEQVVSAIEQGGDWTKQVIASFALTKDQAEALEANPIGEIPNLLSQTYMRAVATSLKYMQQLVPSMLAQQQVQVQRAQEAEKAFFSKWPQLDKAKHGDAIRAFGQAFKAANPNMSQQELIAMVGAAVAAKFGVGTAPAAQGTQVPRSQAFVPAAASAPVAQGTLTQSVPDFFAGMQVDYD